MSRNDFGGTVIPAMAGFFLFGKKAKVQIVEDKKINSYPVVINNGNPDLTGVARYLLAAPLITGVTKYLKKSEKQTLSGVARYVLRQEIIERNAPAQTGVSRYINSVDKVRPSVTRSSVEKYLIKREQAIKNSPVLTGVARYEAEQNRIIRKQAAVELAQRYREKEEAETIAAKAAAAAAYEEAALAQLEDESVMQEANTRVGRYLHDKENAKTKPATSVSRYIAKQIILNSQKPALSKVAKYIQSQSSTAPKAKSLTGVAKYIAQQINTPKTKVTLEKSVQSGVAKYLDEQAKIERNKPILSGVAKYLQQKSDKAPLGLVELPVEEVLEGEFIPANEAAANKTGVSRYLDKMQDVILESKVELTGVARYLESNKSSVSITPVVEETVTGVDRYLLKRAS